MKRFYDLIRSGNTKILRVGNSIRDGKDKYYQVHLTPFMRGGLFKEMYLIEDKTMSYSQASMIALELILKRRSFKKGSSNEKTRLSQKVPQDWINTLSFNDFIVKTRGSRIIKIYNSKCEFISQI